jgi:signal transduction histidine kinase/DNA-binding response OmpR family regulator
MNTKSVFSSLAVLSITMAITFFIFSTLFQPPMSFQDDLFQSSETELDLSTLDFTLDKVLPLDQGWQFASIRKSGELGTMVRKEFTQSWEGFGVGMFQIELKLPAERPGLSIYLGEIIDSWILYANGKKIGETGKLGFDPGTDIPGYRRFAMPLPDTETVRLELFVSNQHHYIGGPFQIPLLGRSDLIEIMMGKRRAADVFISGILLIIGLYHILFYILQEKDLSFLFAGLVATVFAMRIAISGEAWALSYFLRIEWAWYFKLGYISYYLSVFFITSLVYQLFHDPRMKQVLFILGGILMFFSACTLFIPLRHFGVFAWLFQIIVMALIFVTVYSIFGSVRRKKRGSLLFLFAFLMMPITVVHDILVAQNIIHSTLISHFGIFVLTLCQTYILAHRFSQNALAVRKLNIDLEETVRVRTQELLRMTEQANKANNEKSRFLASISHELRTPLSGILGYTELLPDSLVLRKNIQFESERMLKMINQLLDLSKIEAGTLELRNEIFSLGQILENLFTLFQLQAEEKNLRHSQHISGTLSPWYSGDGLKISQVLYNLLENSFKYTAQGYVTLELSVSHTGDEHRIVFSIEDSGVGIKECEQEQILLDFVQGHAGKSIGGSGLGLSLSRKFLQLMGSDLIIQSSSEKGTLICFELCLQPSRGYEQTVSPNHNSLAGLSILLAEDYTPSREILSAQLLQYGVDIEVASNGYEALKIAREKRNIDAFILDLHMPGISGIETASMIRSMPEHNGKKMLLLTADAFTEHRNPVFDAVLTKPVKFDQLSQLLQHLHSDSDFDREFFQAMRKKYRKTILEAADRLPPLLESGTLESIQKELHKLKGLLLNTQLNASAQVCDRLLGNISQNDLDMKEIQQGLGCLERSLSDELPC